MVLGCPPKGRRKLCEMASATSQYLSWKLVLSIWLASLAGLKRFWERKSTLLQTSCRWHHSVLMQTWTVWGSLGSALMRSVTWLLGDLFCWWQTGAPSYDRISGNQHHNATKSQCCLCRSKPFGSIFEEQIGDTMAVLIWSCKQGMLDV